MISLLHFELLKIVASEPNEQVRMVLLRTFCKDQKFVNAIRSLCRNTVKGNLGKTQKEKRKLAKYIKEIRALSNPRNTTKPKIIQTGGSFLTVLVPLAATLLAPLLQNVFKKNDNDSVPGDE